MTSEIRIHLLGGLRVTRSGEAVALPASRKTRALLGFLAATGRPHRRERLCELFWDIPDDPKGALRWSLSKLRKIVDTPQRARIIADRERVVLDVADIAVDIRDAHAALQDQPTALAAQPLRDLAALLEAEVLAGLDGAGDDAFTSWLTAEREDGRAARASVLRLLALHADVPPIEAAKWRRL